MKKGRVKEMEKIQLISWCDDNHEPHYWLGTEYLGTDILMVIKSAFDLGHYMGVEEYEMEQVDITGDIFPEEMAEQLFDYFQGVPALDSVDVELIVAERWQEFSKKNIKKFKKI